MAISVDRSGPRISSEFRLLATLVVATALGPVAMQVFLPALPAIQNSYGASAAEAQLVFSVSAFAMAVATLLYGPLSDRYGRRPTMLTGLVVFIGGSILCVFAWSISVLVLGRVIQAAGGCVGIVLSRVIVRDLYDREHAATMLAWITVAMVAAPMMSPSLGGWLTDAFGWHFVFVASGLAGVLVLFAVAHDLPETAPHVGQRTGISQMFAGFRWLARSPAYVGYVGQSASSMAVFLGFLAGAPYLTVTVYGYPALHYGLFFLLVSGGFMLGNVLAARLTFRFGVERMVVVGSAGSLLGTTLALVLALCGLWSPWALFLPMSLTGLAQGLAMPNAQAAIVSVRPDLAGAASGLGGFVQMSIAAIAAQTIGSIQIGNPYPLTVGVTLIAAMGLAAAIFATRARP